MIAIDVYFLLNFLFDLILLTAVRQLCKGKNSSEQANGKKRINSTRRNRAKQRWKTAAGLAEGAAVGALWSCAAILNPSWPTWVTGPAFWFVVPAAMTKLACRPGSRRELRNAILCFFLLAWGTSGLMNLIAFRFRLTVNGTMIFLLLAAGSEQFFCLVIGLLRRDQDRNLVLLDTTMFYKGKSVRTTGLWDTGNLLRGPYRLPVHLADEACAAELFGTALGEFPKEEQPVPVLYRTVGTDSGVLWAIRIDGIAVCAKDGETSCGPAFLAVSKTVFCRNGEYHVILNPASFSK